MIFNLSEGDDPSGFSRAWGAAFVLLAVILVANVGARTLLARSTRKLSG
jgi:ABC-type phosphate transport system permease subunit